MFVLLALAVSGLVFREAEKVEEVSQCERTVREIIGSDEFQNLPADQWDLGARIRAVLDAESAPHS